jgi:hypothetical protein
MKTKKIKIIDLIYLLGIFMAIISCKKDDSEGTPVRTGQWSGTGISFIVEGTPLKISDLEFAYSGHATGSLCSFDYESAGSFANVTEISGNAFTAEINIFNISGSFTCDTTAEIEITWTTYDSNCNANYSGNRIYIAHFQSTK